MIPGGGKTCLFVWFIFKKKTLVVVDKKWVYQFSIEHFYAVILE